MIIIFKRILAVLAAAALLPVQVFAYDVVNLPESMTFSEALGIYSADDIASAVICDLDHNKYMNMNPTDLKDFYYAASNVTVWRKVNPTPFRGVCVDFTTTNGMRISYYFESGIQIGLYGTDNYICYMPAKDDAVALRYLESEFLDTTEEVYGGAKWSVCTNRDFLKLPSEEWAKNEMRSAASKSLLPYEMTAQYGTYITREQLSDLIANLIVVAGNYASVDSYMQATGTEYSNANFSDCAGRSESIGQMFAIGMVTGKSDTEFDPDGSVTRQELAAFMTRAAERFLYIGSSYSYRTSDTPAIADWAKFYVGWNLETGIMSVDDRNKFYPYAPVTVEQAVTAISRLYDMITVWEE